MAWKYNPFTDALDLTGSGGASYIDGVVADSSLLPVTLGTPALDSVYLAKAGSGVWLINRRPAGLYVRVANNGVAADWTYLGAFPEVNADANWELYNSTDPTKELKFDLSGLPTGTTRTVTGPAGNGQMMVSGQAGAFTTLSATPSSGSALTLTGGTVTASAPLIDATQTWNNGAVTFTGLAATITNTASATASLVARFTVGSTNVFEVDGRGFTTLRKVATTTDFVDILTVRRGTTKVFGVRDDGSTQATGFSCSAGGDGASNMNSSGFGVRSSGSYSISSDGAAFSPDVFLRRDAAGVFAQYNGTNAQTFRIYNTFTSTTNFERLNIIAQSAGSVIIGTEKGSAGGTARALEFQTDATTRFTILSTGVIGLGASGSSSGLGASGLFVNTGAAQISMGSYLSSVQAYNQRVEIWGDNAAGTAAVIMLSCGKDLVRFGGTTSSFPALKRSSTVLQARLANDSDFCPLQGQLRTHANAVTETITADKTLTLYDAAGTAYKVPCVAA